MDIYKITASELKNADIKQLREAEESIRRKMQENRLEAFLAASPKTGEQRKLRKSLARVLTVRSDRRRASTKEGAKS